MLKDLLLELSFSDITPMKEVQWSAWILLPSNRLQKVEFMCESNLKQDAENKCKSLFGVSDVRQLKREWN